MKPAGSPVGGVVLLRGPTDSHRTVPQFNPFKYTSSPISKARQTSLVAPRNFTAAFHQQCQPGQSSHIERLMPAGGVRSPVKAGRGCFGKA